jgi:dTDP-4-amino-4,6-dideoxygalactose transaminase
VQQRRDVYNFYFSNLSGKQNLRFLPEPEGFFSNRWLTTVVIERPHAGFSAESIRLMLEKENIESRPLWKPMHLQPFFKSFPHYAGGISEHLFNTGLCLPSGSNLTVSEKERIMKVLIRLPQ